MKQVNFHCIRLSSLSKQRQLNLILSRVSTSNPLCEKLEEEIGESLDAKEKGFNVIKDKHKEWFGKQEDIDVFLHYQEFECKIGNQAKILSIL